ncbi:hypothetical protein [Streptomyces sp. NPDC001970]
MPKPYFCRYFLVSLLSAPSVAQEAAGSSGATGVLMNPCFFMQAAIAFCESYCYLRSAPASAGTSSCPDDPAEDFPPPAEDCPPSAERDAVPQAASSGSRLTATAGFRTVRDPDMLFHSIERVGVA